MLHRKGTQFSEKYGCVYYDQELIHQSKCLLNPQHCCNIGGAGKKE